MSNFLKKSWLWVVGFLKKWWLPVAGFGMVAGMWLYFDGYAKAMGDGPDKFDSLNSLFAGLAFVGMLCTLFMQRQELSLQRQELEETRKVLAKTSEETNRLASATEDNLRHIAHQLRLSAIDKALEIHEQIKRKTNEDVEMYRELIRERSDLLCNITGIGGTPSST